MKRKGCANLTAIRIIFSEKFSIHKHVLKWICMIYKLL